MTHIESAYRDGVGKARRDIRAGHPRLHHGARGPWHEALAQALQARFGVELIALSCITTDASLSFVAGYNATTIAHIDSIHGAGSLEAVRDAVLEEVDRRWEAGHDARVARRGAAERALQETVRHES